MPFSLFEGALGGIGLFLYGMRLTSEGVRSVAHSRIRSFFSICAANRFSSFLLGLVSSMLLQSGSAAVIFLFALLRGGLLNSFQSINILAGILLGSSLALNFSISSYHLIAPFFIFFGVVVHFFARKLRYSHWGKLVLGVGLLFLGLSLLEGSYRPINHHPFYEIFDGYFYRTPLSAAFFGLILSLLVQSAQTSTAIVASLLKTYTLSISSANSMIAGSFISLSCIAILATLGADKIVKRIGVFFLFVSISSTLVCGLFQNYFVGIFKLFFNDLDSLYSSLAALHLTNSIMSAFLLTLSSSFLSRTLFFAGAKTDDMVNSSVSAYLDSRILSTPTIALEQSRKEIVRMVAIVSGMVADTEEMLNRFDARRSDSIRQREHLVDTLNHEISRFLATLSHKCSDAIRYDVARYIHIVSSIEHIADRCEEVLKAIEAKKEADVFFSDDAMDDIKNQAQFVMTMIVMVENSVVDSKVYGQDFLDEKKLSMKKLYSNFRLRHIERISGGVCSPGAMIYFNDIMTAYIRILEECWFIMEEQMRGNNENS